jgi:hypothetical protein
MGRSSLRSLFCSDQRLPLAWHPALKKRWQPTDFLKPYPRTPRQLSFVCSAATNMTPLVEVSTSFAKALVRGDFKRAHALLAPELQRTLTPELLESEFYGMFRGYSNGEATDIWYDEKSVITDWPGKMSGDLGCLYIAIRGEDFNEAVTVSVADIKGTALIREIIWGRP